MPEPLTSILPLIIPILALLIGLVVVGSIFIVHPVVNAITRLTEAQGGREMQAEDPAILKLEQRMASLERSVHRVLDEHEFTRELMDGAEAPARARASRTADVQRGKRSFVAAGGTPSPRE